MPEEKEKRQKPSFIEEAVTEEPAQSNAVAVLQNKNLVPLKDDISFNPSEWADIDAANLENTSAAEMQIPRIGIAQPTSPMLAAGTPGWKAGMLFDTISKDIITIEGKAPWLINKGVDPATLVNANFMVFVPIMKLPTEYVMWPTKEEREEGRKAYHWKTLDRNDQRVRDGSWPPTGTFNEEGKAPPVTEHLNILGIGLDLQGNIKTGMILASFSRTSFRTGQKLSTVCINQKSFGLPYWGMVHYLFTVMRQENNNTYYVIQSAKGPTLMKYCNQDTTVFKTCFMIAKDLAGNKEKQSKLLNAAAFDEHDGSIVTHTEDAGVGVGVEPEF